MSGYQAENLLRGNTQFARDSNLLEQIPGREWRIATQGGSGIPPDFLSRKRRPQGEQVGAGTPDQSGPASDHQIVARVIKGYAMHDCGPRIQESSSIKFEYFIPRRGIGALAKMNNKGSLSITCTERTAHVPAKQQRMRPRI